MVERARQYQNLYSYLNITIITYYEVMKGHEYIGAYGRQKLFDEFCELNKVILLNPVACKKAAQIYANLRRRGKLFLMQIF